MHKVKTFLWVIILLLTISSCAPVDLSTDEGVLEAINRRQDEPLELDDLCIKRFDELQNIILIGFFAYDVGCQYEEIYVGNRFGSIDEMTPRGLEENGWQDESNREALALLWARKVLYSDGDRRIINSEPDVFAEHGERYTKPDAKLQSDGSVKLSFWSAVDWDMSNESVFSKQEMTFSPRGEPNNSKTLRKFQVSYD